MAIRRACACCCHILSTRRRLGLEDLQGKTGQLPPGFVGVGRMSCPTLPDGKCRKTAGGGDHVVGGAHGAQRGTGPTYLDCPLSRGALYLILQNRISRGSG